MAVVEQELARIVQQLDEMLVTDGDYGLHARKEGLGLNSDALIALPGGTGTIEELREGPDATADLHCHATVNTAAVSIEAPQI